MCLHRNRSCVAASVFLLGFTTLGIPVDNTGMWIMTCILGLFVVKHVLTGDIDGEYGELFWECAIAWGFWVLLAVAREFFGAGTIFGNSIYQGEFQSKIFQDTMFGFLTAGMALAFTNGVLKKKSTNTHSLLVVLPLAVFMQAICHGKLRSTFRTDLDHCSTGYLIPVRKGNSEICANQQGV